MADILTLVCRICRWHPPGDLEMNLVQAHFDIEPDHDPTDIKLEMVGWCHRCDAEMNLMRTEPMASGQLRHHYDCPRCHRSGTVLQNPDGAGHADV